MIWFPHKKYTADYVNGQLTEIFRRVRCSTRCMVMVAGFAVTFAAVAHASCIYGL